jgi:hypothetical protein
MIMASFGHYFPFLATIMEKPNPEGASGQFLALG